MYFPKSYFPKTYFPLKLREYREIKANIRKLFKEMEILAKINKGNSIDSDGYYTKRRNQSSILNINLKNKMKKISLNNTCRNPKTNITLKKIDFIKKKKIRETLLTKKPENKIVKINIIKTKKNYPLTPRNNFDVKIINKENIIFKNKLIKAKLSSNSQIGNSTTRNKSLNKSLDNIMILKYKEKEAKKLFKIKYKKLLKTINTIEKNSEKKEKILSKKANIKSPNFIKKNSTKQKDEVALKIDKEFNKNCKIDMVAYHKQIGLFYRSSKNGLYTSHFSSFLRQDNFFPNDIIYKMPKYFMNAK